MPKTAPQQGRFSFTHSHKHFSTTLFPTHVNCIYHRRYYAPINVPLTIHTVCANMYTWLRNNRLKPSQRNQLLINFHSDSSTTRPFKRSNAKFVFVRSKHSHRFQSKTPPVIRRCFIVSSQDEDSPLPKGQQGLLLLTRRLRLSSRRIRLFIRHIKLS